MAAISIQLPDDISQRLQQLSELTGRSQNDYMIEALRKHLDKIENDVAEQRVIDNRAGRSKTYTLDEAECDLGLAD